MASGYDRLPVQLTPDVGGGARAFELAARLEEGWSSGGPLYTVRHLRPHWELREKDAQQYSY